MPQQRAALSSGPNAGLVRLGPSTSEGVEARPKSGGGAAPSRPRPRSAVSFRFRRNMSSVALLWLAAATMGSLPWASAVWNASCPAPCLCSVLASEMDHQTVRRTANCSYQSLKVLPPDLPKDTEALLATGNHFREMYHSLPDLAELKELDMSGNRMRSLGRGYIFHNLSGLTYLNLAKNELVELVSDAFFGLINLKMLIVSGNRIDNIQDQAFHGLTNLQVLDLGQNQLSSLYSEWFYGLSSLKQLHLHENRVHQVNGATFRVLRRLQHLSLHGNRISHVASDGFWDLANLETLHLERNYLQQVPTAALRGLPSLEAAYLNGNPFTALRTGDFADLPVRELFLNGLPYLRLVEAGAFRNLSRLEVLELRDCRALAFLDAEAFINVTVLRHVDLQNNNLSTVPGEVVGALPAGCEVALKGNPFLCDCNVRWIRKELELVQRNASRVRLVDAEQLECRWPPPTHSIPLHRLDPAGAMADRCAPSILPLMAAAVEKRLGDQLSLDCRAAGQPPPTIQWTLPGGVRLTRGSDDGRVQLQPSGTLYYRHLNEDDGGRYTCTARNSEGAAEYDVLVRVRPIDIHIFPDTESSTFVILVWNGTERNSFRQFQILYQQVPSSGGGSGTYSCRANGTLPVFRRVNVSPSYRYYTISSLQPDSTYEFCLTFEDPQGYNICISCTVARTKDADYMHQGIHRTSNVAVAVVLGIIVTMVMVICFVTVAARKYRQRQYICPDKPIVHRMSHIPLENLYSPLMSSAGP